MDRDAHDVRAALRADAAACARLYDRHAPVVLSFCRRRTMTDAEDAMQETFIRAFAKLDSLADPERFRAWLYAIARHVCSEQRRASTRRTHHEAVGAAQHNERTTKLNSEVSTRATRDEQMHVLTRAMQRLDERERLALHLQYLDPDPLVAAEELGLSRSGYYKLVSRARVKLETYMREVVST